jgi:hypothetical protein
MLETKLRPSSFQQELVQEPLIMSYQKPLIDLDVQAIGVLGNYNGQLHDLDPISYQKIIDGRKTKSHLDINTGLQITDVLLGSRLITLIQANILDPHKNIFMQDISNLRLLPITIYGMLQKANALGLESLGLPLLGNSQGITFEQSVEAIHRSMTSLNQRLDKRLQQVVIASPFKQ